MAQINPLEVSQTEDGWPCPFSGCSSVSKSPIEAQKHLQDMHPDAAASRYFIYRNEAGIGTDIEGDGETQAIVLPKAWNLRAEHAFFQIRPAPLW